MIFSESQPPQLDTLDGLYAYLNGKFDRPQIPSLDEYLALDQTQRSELNSRRLDYVAGDLVINTPSIAAIVLDVQRALVANRRKASGRFGVMISGASGMGKTTAALAAMRYAFSRYRAEVPQWESCGRLPIVYVEAPPSASGKAVISRFAQFLQLPVRNSDTLEALEAVVVAGLNAAGTRLVVVDELHNLSKTSPGNGQSVDVLKSLSNRIAATFVYSGINIHSGPLLSGERGQQIKSRYTPRVIRPFAIANADDWKIWHGLIRSFEKELCLLNHHPGDLAEHARYLFDNTSGSIGNLARWLTSAAADLVVQEITPEDERLGIEQLAQFKPLIENHAA